MNAGQTDLFAATEPSVDRDFRGAVRTPLDDVSWVDHVPGWFAGSDRLFAELLDRAAFEQRTRWMYDRRVDEPRLTAEYDDVADAPHPLFAEIAAVLGDRYRATYRRMWINLYRDHHDSTGWHGDAVGRRQATSCVPVLSLGATRRFLIRPAAGGASIRFTVAAGDLVVMGGEAQRGWRHCVPKQTTPAGPRISINLAPEPPR